MSVVEMLNANVHLKFLLQPGRNTQQITIKYKVQDDIKLQSNFLKTKMLVSPDSPKTDKLGDRKKK